MKPFEFVCSAAPTSWVYAYVDTAQAHVHDCKSKCFPYLFAVYGELRLALYTFHALFARTDVMAVFFQLQSSGTDEFSQSADANSPARSRRGESLRHRAESTFPSAAFK